MGVRPAEPRHTFSVNIRASLYQKLVSKAGRGRIGTFINQVLEKELGDDNEQKLIADYKSVAQSQARKKEDEMWDEATDDGLE